MILLTQTDKKVAVEYTNLLIFAVYLFWCIQDREKSTSNDDETHCIIYKAIVNWITKSFRIQMALVRKRYKVDRNDNKDELVRNTRLTENPYTNLLHTRRAVLWFSYVGNK